MCDMGMMGGAGGDVYSNPMNTMGMGDVVPPTENHYGSGDKFDNFFGQPSKKKSVLNMKQKKPQNQNNPARGFQTSTPASDMMKPRPLYVPYGNKK